MGSTTRRISETELKKLKNIQKHLESQNIKMSQAELSEAIINFVIGHFDEFFLSLTQETLDKNDPLTEWLNSPVTGEKDSNAVEEHDVIM